MLHFKSKVLSVILIWGAIDTVQALELATANLTFKSNLIQRSCEVSDESSHLTVELKKWSTRELYQSGDKTQPIPFTIQLKNCLANNLSVTFQGQGDATDSTLLALDQNAGASNVAIEILDENTQRISLSVPVKYENNDDSNLQLNYAARYISTATRVGAGSANATANFILSYD